VHGHDRIEEDAIVADDEDRLRVRLEVGLQPEDSREIQVIRRLIEEEEVGTHEEGTGESDAH
jgi:hypothetical protein